MRVAQLYSCFGFSLDSDVPLPELARADDAGAAVVTVRRGPVPGVLVGAPPALHGLQVSGDTALLIIPAAARYLIRRGREIVVEAMPDASERNLRLFLLGSALGVLCHQRGLMLLHASTIRTGTAAVAFAGHSGAGKSTLAAYFALRGYEILGDDVCALSFDARGQPLAWPGLPRLKLWGEAAAAFGHDRAGLETAIEDEDKYHVPLGPAASRPLPLRRLYLLTRAEGSSPAIAPLTGGAAMKAVTANTYRGAWLGALGLSESHFRQCLSLLGAIQVFTVSRRWGYDVFAEEARRLEAHLAEVEA